MKKLIGMKILRVLLFCFVSASVFGSSATAVWNDSLPLLCKSRLRQAQPALLSDQKFGFDKLRQRSSSTSTSSVTLASDVTSTLPCNIPNGFTSAHIALSTVSVALFILNSPSHFGNLLLLASIWLAFLLMFRCLANATRTPKFILILLLFFSFAGKDATANRLQNGRLTHPYEQNQLVTKFAEITSTLDFAKMASAVTAPAATITSTATGGNWSNTATWVGGVVPGAGDEVIIANGATVTIDMDAPALGSLTIGQGTSGILQYDAIAVRTITVSGIVTVKSGAQFRSAAVGSTSTITTHSLLVGGSIINDGTINFSSTAGAVGAVANASGAGITFTGASNAVFNCEGSTLINLRKTNGLILNKGTSTTSVLTFSPGGTFQVLSGTTNGFLSITNGTFKIIGTNFFTNPVFSIPSYVIPNTGGFELSNPNATVVGQNGSVDNNGELRITDGIFNVGIVPGNSSVTNNNGKFMLTGGVMNVAGRFLLSNATGTFTGGNLNISTIGHASSTLASFECSLTSVLSISGSTTITIINPNSSATPSNDIDIFAGSGTKTITGGTFQIGTSTTLAGSTFKVNSDIPLYNLTVFNSNTKVSLTDNLTVNNQLSLNGGNIDGTTNSKKVILTNPNITSIDRSSGFIIGQMQRAIGNTGGIAYLFPVGNGSNYTPLLLNFSGANNGGSITVSSTAGDHVSLGSSLLNPAKSVNNYWTVTNSGVTFSDLGGDFTFPSSIAEAGTYKVGIYDGSVWTYPPVTSANATSVSFTGVSSLGTSSSFALAECIPPTITETLNVCAGLTTQLTGSDLPAVTNPWVSGTASVATVDNNGLVTGVSAGTSAITYTNITGCTITATVTVNPTTGPTSFTAGATTVCQNAADETYTATAANSTSIAYSVSPAGAGTINSTTGAMNWDAAFSGTATITATASGLCGTTSADRVVTVNPLPTLTGASQASDVCEGSAATINLTGLLANSTSTISYTINGIAQTAVTGVVANGSGNGSFTTTVLTAANNGQNLQITGITSTSVTPNCSQAFTQNVTLTVNTVPVLISCPSPSLSFNAATGACTASASYTVTASGQPAPAYTYTFTGATIGSGSGTGSGSTFNSGTTNVKVTATNTCGSVDCIFSVTVTDNTPPVIAGCPAIFSVNTGIGRTTCDQVASWTEPTATDNCTASASLVWTKSHLPGSTFPVGTTTVTYSVRDASNNSATCTLTVTVVDNTPPTFTPPGAIAINSTGACSFDSDPSKTGLPSGVSDNCTLPANPISYIDVQTNSVPPACTYPFTITRTWKVTDSSGNFTTHDQIITVRDVTPPQITSMPATKYVECNTNYDPVNPADFPTATDCSAVTFSWQDATVAGNCTGKATVTRTWKATDCSRNFSTANQTIEINDTQPPQVTFPTGLRLEEKVACPDNIPDKDAFLTRVIASDICGSVTVEFVREEYYGLGGKPGFCPTGLTRFYRVRDNCNNSVEVSHFIEVLGECQCAYCVDTPFEYANLETTPVWTSLERSRGGKSSICCPTADDNCTSFFLWLGKDYVGLKFSIIKGAIPGGALYYKIDCEGAGAEVGQGKCLAGGRWYTLSFCKPGDNENIYQIEAIKGVTSADNITTRIDCNGNLAVTGVVPATVTWTDKSGSGYERYITPSSGSLTPVFYVPEADKDLVPPFIDYEVCGQVTGTTVCGASFIDCKTIRVNILPKIKIAIDIQADKICEGQMPVITPTIDPPDNDYVYHWYNNLGVEILPSPGSSFLPPAEGDYSVKVVKRDEILVCNEATMPFTVKYDKTGPVIVGALPLPLYLSCDDNDKLQKVSDWLATFKATYTGSDGIPVIIAMTPSYPSINNVPCGTIPVTFTAADQCGNDTTIYSSIIISDTTPPTITCPGPVSNVADIGKCFASSINLGTPTATDNCSSVTFTNDAPATFPVGVTTVTWTGTDACGNSSTCSQTVTVTDNNQAPVFTTCPGNQVQTALPGYCFLSNVILPDPVATDNCAVTKLTWTMSGATTGTSRAIGINYVSGQTFNVGITTVTYLAFDAAGNQSLPCSFDVWIKDLNKPVFTVGCPVDVTTNADPGLCTVAITVPIPAVTDPCNEGYTLTNSFNSTNNASGNYPVGLTNVTWTITDASGNVKTCTQTVTVTDAQLPTIACQADVEEQVAANNCSKTGVAITNPVIGDNCPNPVLTWALTGATIASGTGPIPASQPFNVGKTQVTYTITDASLNMSTCSFQVWIKSLVTPQFAATCPVITTITQNAEAGRCDANITTIPAPTILNPCNEAYTMVNSFNGTNNANGVYPIGGTPVTWTITDASGNITTCIQTVTVTDLMPVITCPANIVIQADFELPYKDVVVVPEPTYSDNCPNPVLTWVMVDPLGATTSGSGDPSGKNVVPSPSRFMVGVTTITYTVTDSNGNTVSCSFTVTVESEPKISCPADILQNTDIGVCTATLNPGFPVKISGAEPITYIWVMTGATTGSGTGAIGNYDFKVGISTITWTATNISGTDNCSHLVTVSDKEPPTFTLPTLAAGYCVENIFQAVYNNVPDTDPTDLTFLRPDYYLFKPGFTMLNLSSVADNCALAANPIAWIIDFGNNGSTDLSGTGQLSVYGTDIQFPLGTNRITYTVTDLAGNTTVQFVDMVVIPRPGIIRNF